MTETERSRLRCVITSPAGVAVLGCLLVLVAVVVVQQTALALAVLPFALVLLCPLSHIFLHGSHQHASGSATEPPPDAGSGQ